MSTKDEDDNVEIDAGVSEGVEKDDEEEAVEKVVVEMEELDNEFSREEVLLEIEELDSGVSKEVVVETEELDSKISKEEVLEGMGGDGLRSVVEEEEIVADRLLELEERWLLVLRLVNDAVVLETTEERLLLEKLDVRLLALEPLDESVLEVEIEELDIVDENAGSDTGDERFAETEIPGSESLGKKLADEGIALGYSEVRLPTTRLPSMAGTKVDPGGSTKLRRTERRTQTVLGGSLGDEGAA
ncbi:hypothetical protein G7Y79_00017g042200 [Physcia stellaris]|nr:hypothetical protein G7Y79_00017g042200 [Physcia stellaris]